MGFLWHLMVVGGGLVHGGIITIYQAVASVGIGGKLFRHKVCRDSL